MELKYTIQQKQKFSARQQQAAKVLQMGRNELEAFLQQESLENPLLEYEEGEKEDFVEHDTFERLEWLAETDKQNYLYYEQDYNKDRDYQFDNYKVETEDGLPEYIFSQFYSMKLSKKEWKILEYLVFSLDERGYFTDEIEVTANVLKVRIEDVEKCLNLLKSAEPAGIGAKDIKECLLLQVNKKGLKDDTIVRTIISDYLELLSKNQLSVLANRIGVSMGDILESVQIIRELNPKPANGFAYRDNLKYLKPDVTVVKFRDRFEIILNESLSRVSIHSYYSRMLKEDIDIETKNYIKEKLSGAKWIIQCVQQRASTLGAVSRELVEMQTDFFEHGQGHLVSLTMKQVADRLGLHEATISRTVKDKYLQCTWGIFPMTYFFVKKLGNSTGTEGTVLYAKSKLKEFILQENKKAPYSDQKLSDLLKEDGIILSRRTVAKYREELGIPEKGKRKEYDS